MRPRSEASRRMSVNAVLYAIGVGIVVGVLGRLILPGRQHIGAILTVLIGIGSALLGTYVTKLLGWSEKTPVSFVGLHWHWIQLGIQVGFAVVATALAAAISHTRVAAQPAGTRTKRPRRT
jgi:uncharacterized membrane protein YeaQ/YmgE (transglycosylase-associated protein family)